MISKIPKNMEKLYHVAGSPSWFISWAWCRPLRIVSKGTDNVVIVGKCVLQNANNWWWMLKTLLETLHVYKLMKAKWRLNHILHFWYHLPYSKFSHLSANITHWLYLLSTASVFSITLWFWVQIWVLWGPVWTYPKFDLTRFSPKFCICHMQKSSSYAF